MTRKFSILGMALAAMLVIISQTGAITSFETLKEGQKINGFTALNVYLNGADRAMGARFISDKYHFIVDIMQIQSVPQGFFWVKTQPTSDKGQAHTCEHLLLGKGNRGRYVAALEDMSLGNSTAFTGQLRTCYHFNTIAGGETFYNILEAKLMAFLHPDFTDEEIRREVCHIGVVEDPETGRLGLEEKGTVYTEMVSAFEKPWYYYYEAMNDMLYGKDHPLSYTSGGRPEALRTLTPEDLRSFHRANYHLANMGIIVAIPDDISPDDFLRRLGAILERCQEVPTTSDNIGMDKYALPDPKPAPFGRSTIITYPSENEQDRGDMYFSWPARLSLDNDREMLLELFMLVFSGGTTSNLYDIFINSETRRVDLGASFVGGWVSNDLGRPVWITLNGLDKAYVTTDMVDSVRSMTMREIKRIYDFADSSEDLLAFDKRVEGRLIQERKNAEDYLNKPPMFGFRSGSAGGWLMNLMTLEKEKGFRKSLIFKNDFAYAESLLATRENIWKGLIDDCHFLDTKPYAVGTLPDPGMVTAAKEEKSARIDGYINEFKMKYGFEDDQEAIARYKAEFDRKTEALEKIAASQPLPDFMDNPPMTLDDQLEFETITLPSGIPMVASTFENMNSSTVAIALRLDVVPESLLVYIPILPGVMTSIGVIEDGAIVPYQEMKERLRKEVLDLRARFDQGFQSGRIELVLLGAGSNLDELRNCLHWMELSLYSPYLSTDNIPRLTDILDQQLIALRNVMKGDEENWVSYPSYAYRFQDNPLFLTTNNFLTKVHHLHRLRCMLTDPGNQEDQKALAGFIDALARYGADKSRAELLDQLDLMTGNEATVTDSAGFHPMPGELSEHAAENARYVARAFKATLPDIPDANLQEDWLYLCRETKSDMLIPPEKAIDGFKAVLNLICKVDNARMFMISNSSNRRATQEQINAFVARLDSGHPSVRQEYDHTRRILARLKSRVSDVDRPVYVGLVHEGTANGVIMGAARFAPEYDTSTNSVLDCLAGKMYGGGGAHGLFMKTWGAGLAYSNGYNINESNGRMSYYAERCPDVAETMRFVVNELKNAKPDSSLVDYAVAQVFLRSRAASTYEARGETMAADLADGLTPERVAAFRSKVLQLRHSEGLYEKLFDRMEDVYGRVLIGYGKPLAAEKDAYFFVVGPEEQFQSLENYIEKTEGKQPVYRLYPRDFWLTI
jgi:Zn-dependent M16 (insulinase) family peptidase